ncbi:MAG: hypothetical protein M3R13_04695 [Armatimonadota bacterium]|nr:hypothetical protein [Armatimonadota bacterium]
MKEQIMLLEARLARAERNARFAVLTAVATIVVAFAAGCGTNSFKTLKAEKIEVVDASGKTVGLLFGDEQGGGLSLDDSDGKPRIAFAAAKENPRMEIYDAAGKVRVALNAEGEGSALALCDTNGNPRANLFYYDNQSWVGFFDAEGKLSMRIPEEQ